MKAVVFDMDGVLFDTERLSKDAWSVIGEKYGYEGMNEVAMECVGLNVTDIRVLVKKRFGEDFSYDRFREEEHEWIEQEIEKNGIPVKPGAREILSYLKEAGYLVGLASSTAKPAVLRHLERAGFTDYFQAVTTGDMVEHSKPQPDIYLMACKELGVKPKEAYAIEDSPNGIRSAHGAGMCPIMVPDLVQPDDEMRRLSSYIFHDLLEVKTFLEKGQE